MDKREEITGPIDQEGNVSKFASDVANSLKDPRFCKGQLICNRKTRRKPKNIKICRRCPRGK